MSYFSDIKNPSSMNMVAMGTLHQQISRLMVCNNTKTAFSVLWGPNTHRGWWIGSQCWPVVSCCAVCPPARGNEGGQSGPVWKRSCPTSGLLQCYCGWTPDGLASEVFAEDLLSQGLPHHAAIFVSQPHLKYTKNSFTLSSKKRKDSTRWDIKILHFTRLFKPDNLLFQKSPVPKNTSTTKI